MSYTEQLEIIYEDMGAFARAIVPKRTYWSLKELMKAADLPKDAELTGGLKRETYDEFRDASIEDIQVFVDRYYDKDGNELIRKSKMKTRNVKRQERYEEVSFVQKTTPSQEGGETVEPGTETSVADKPLD